MPGTIKVKEVIRRISALMQDNKPQFVRMTEREIVDYLNDAQRAIHTHLPSSCSRLDAIRLAPGTMQTIESIPAANCKPGDGSTPSKPVIGTMLVDVLCNMGPAGTVPGKAIRSMTEGRELLDAIEPNWHTTTGTEVSSYLYDPRTPLHFHVVPGVPAAPQVWARIAYIADPLDIPNTGTPGAELYADSGSSTTTISVHDSHIDDLVNYVCARLLMKNAQYSASTGMSAEAYAALFTGSINAKAQAILGNNPNLKHLPFAPSPAGAAS